MATATVTLDSKGRVSIPLEVRQALGIRPGAILFLALALEEGELRLKVANDPYKEYGPVARQVIAEYEQHPERFTSLRQLAAEEGIDPDAPKDTGADGE